jgi:predicted RNA methylase
VRAHDVVVEGLPAWLDAARLLGAGDWRFQPRADGTVQALARLEEPVAADLDARLRGLGLGGNKLAVRVVPALPRVAVRAARTVDARRRREASPGFTRRGTQLDDEARISLTPEPLADALAAQLASLRVRSVLDLCAGAGGNAIAFARAGLHVVAVERDAARLAMLAHNARVCGVDAQIDRVCGDAIEAARTGDADVLFIDPPWGTDYDRARTNIDALPPLREVLEVARARGIGERGAFRRVIAKVPPSFDVVSVPGAAASAVFGASRGDAQRVKFVLLTLMT